MRDIRGNDISMIFQEPMTSLNPVLTIGRQIGETLRLHEGLDKSAAAEARGRDADAGRHRRAAAAGEGVSAPALRRDAPAGDDRDGAGLQSEAPDRRRADHRARRDDPGADPRPDARSETPRRRRHHPDHARSRRGRRSGRARDGDVCGPQGGGGAGRRSVPHAAPSLHAGAARRGAEARLVADAARRAGSPKFRGWCRASSSASRAACSPAAVRWRPTCAARSRRRSN